MAMFFSNMDWKSTAVISGAGILATWFFSMPTPNVPARVIPPAARVTPATTPTIDIEKEAARLQIHRTQEPPYTAPARNPFRFTERREPPRATPAVVVAQPAVIVPPPPRITLDGVASDSLDGQTKRTAILNANGSVVLVKEGDQVAEYRVQKIAADAVELVKIDDGSVLRLGLR